LLAKTWAGTVDVPVGKELIAVGIGISLPGGLVTWTVAVALVVRRVVEAAEVGGEGKADEDGEAATAVVAGVVEDSRDEAGGGDGGVSDVVELAGCVISVAEVEAGSTATSVEAFEFRGLASLGVPTAIAGTDVELAAASLVGTLVVGALEAEVVASAEVMIAPGSVALEVKLLTPLVGLGAILV
jgi:hypothetical protein